MFFSIEGGWGDNIYSRGICLDVSLRIAMFVSSLAHCVNRDNNSVAKVKSILMQKEGLTNEGLDATKVSGFTESSRSQRNIRDFFAGINSEVLKSAAGKYPHVRTMDNLDIRIGGLTHHFTQEFIELEQSCTKQFDTSSKPFEEMLELFKASTILMNSEENKHIREHFDKVAAITVGRMLAERLKKASFLKPLFENHYEHPNKSLNPNPAVLFIQKPLYLHEIVNDEMMQIEEEVQLDFLKLTAELVSDKPAFLADVDQIQNSDSNKSDREAAEARIHSAILEAGEYIGNL